MTNRNRYRLDVRVLSENNTREVYLFDATITDGRFLLCDQNCPDVDLLKIKELVRLANKQIRSEVRHGK